MTDATPTVPAIFRTRDLVGWEVVDREGEKIGAVADLLLDRRGKVRYVDVEFGFPKKHLLLPDDQLEWGDSRLILTTTTRERALTLPPYDPGKALHEGLVAEMMRAFPWMYDPEAEPASALEGDSRIVPLSEAKDFRIEAGAPDPRGWNVFGADGERVGTVTQLLVDPAALKVRYLDVDLSEDLFQLRDDRHVLVPIELADLKLRGGDVWVRDWSANEIARLPAYLKS